MRGQFKAPARTRAVLGQPQAKRGISTAGRIALVWPTPPSFLRKRQPASAIPRDCTDDFDAGNLLQFADLLHGEIGLACEKPFGGKPGWNDRRAGVDFGRYPIRSINRANKMPLAPIRE